MTNLWWVALFFGVITMVTPLTPENEPPMLADGTLAWAPAVVAGLPWWFFKLLMISALSTLMLLVSIYNAPDEFPKLQSDTLVMERMETRKIIEEGESFDFGADNEESHNGNLKMLDEEDDHVAPEKSSGTDEISA